MEKENKQPMSLPEYMVAIVEAHGDNGADLERINYLKETYGGQTTTFDEVEQGIAVMTRSLMQDALIGEQVQGVFNQSILELLIGKGIITENDMNNVAEIMTNATHQLYKEIENSTATIQEEK